MLPNDFSFSSNLVIIYADPVPVRHRTTDPAGIDIEDRVRISYQIGTRPNFVF